MLNPQFPYKDNQLILSSDRIIVHSKSDAIFLFGKEAVSLSSTKTINLDANEKILIDCNKIELGNKAETDGQPVVLGNELNNQLIKMLEMIADASVELSQVSTSNPGLSMQAIARAGLILNSEASRILGILKQKDSSGSNSPILSKNTFTR